MRNRRLDWCVGWLIAAFAWALMTTCVIAAYHVQGFTTGSSVTLLQKDRFLFTIAIGAVWFTVLAGIVDLTVRSWRKSASLGVFSLITGSLLVLYSLFGLVFGVLGIGLVGVFVMLSARPLPAPGGSPSKTQSFGQAVKQGYPPVAPGR